MHEITIIEFVRPNGRQNPLQGNVQESAFLKYEELTSLGLRVTAENLNNGKVNFCIEHPKYGDFKQIVIPNDPDTVLKVESMLESFNADDYARWLARAEEI